MNKSKLFQKIASACGAYNWCIANGSAFASNHLEAIKMYQDALPSGSGIDRGTKIELDETNEDKITLSFGFHHMDENGYYDGWTEHEAIITPSFDGFRLKITGRDRNQIKDYLYDTFHFALNQEV